MVDRIEMSHVWSQVVEQHPVPPNLHAHQLDAMSLLRQGKHVLLGIFQYFINWHSLLIISAVPTGAGKTLPQLTTMLVSLIYFLSTES